MGTRHDAATLELDELVTDMVAFHGAGVSLPLQSGDGADVPRQMATGEVGAIRELLPGEEDRQRLSFLEAWVEQDLIRLGPLLEARESKRGTSWALTHPDSRLCHEGRILMANAIGFDLHGPGAALPADPASDLASLMVGLEIRGESALTRQALDLYLRLSGDYEAARLLSLFGSCHALAGARRSLERHPGSGQDPEHPALLAESIGECRRYLALAERIAEFRFPPLVIAVGVSGSGKSRFTNGLVTRLGAIRVCSDVERRRLHGLDAAASHPQLLSGHPPVDIFSDEATAITYRRLASCAGTLLDAGITACVDGTFLHRWQRDLLRQQAEARGLPCLLVSFEADNDTLERRIKKRALRRGADPAESRGVLHEQQANYETFGDEERLHLVHLDTTADNAAETLVCLIEEHIKLT